MYLGNARRNGIVTVDGLRLVDTDQLTDIRITTPQDGTYVEFKNRGSTFRTLTAQGDGGLLVHAGITTSLGSLTLDGDMESVADAKTLEFGDGVTVERLLQI